MSRTADASNPILTDTLRESLAQAQRQVNALVLGKPQEVRLAFVALLSGGHLLIEDLPGLGKTSLVRAFADALDLRFSRIQFTPDLMPADIVGTDILEEQESGRRAFRFQAGPVFANIVHKGFKVAVSATHFIFLSIFIPDRVLSNELYNN